MIALIMLLLTIAVGWDAAQHPTGWQIFRVAFHGAGFGFLFALFLVRLAERRAARFKETT